MLELVKLIKICEFIQTTEFAACIHVRTTFPFPCVFVFQKEKKRKEKEIQFFSFNLPPHQTLHLFQSNNSFPCVNK